MNDKPTPKEQILNPVYEGPVDVEGFGTARPMGHTGELRRTKEENRELRARVEKLEAAIRKLDATDTAYRHSGLGDPAQAYADLISLVQ